MIQDALHKGDPIEWMANLMEGRDTLKVSEDIACGVVMTHADFPYFYDKPEVNTGAPLYGLTKTILKDFRLVDVCMRKAPVMESGQVVDELTWCTAGNYIGVATGCGNTVDEACQQAYACADKIDVPSNLMLRNDIGKRLEKQLPVLHRHGYAKGMTYS
jgi:phosphoribosylamine-glycine ligase